MARRVFKEMGAKELNAFAADVDVVCNLNHVLSESASELRL